MPPEIRKRIKVMALMESTTVTGPAKNLIEFAQNASQPDEQRPGVEMAFVTFHRPGASEDFIEAVKQAGLKITVIPEKRAFDAGVLPSLRAAIRNFAPDILQTHNIKSHFLVKWLGLHRARPWVAFHHGHTTTDIKMRVYNQIDRYSLRSAHHVVTVCRPYADDIVRMGVRPARITVQHNMIKPFVRPSETQLNSLRSALGIPSGTRVLLGIGRFSREKAHIDLIRAAAQLRRDAPEIDFRLLLVGEGPERTGLKRLSQDLGLGERITFVGYQRDVSPYYAIADIYALPSHNEGSPNTLLEAMAAGIPTVATRVGGVPEIAIHEKNAWLVPKGDSVEMARGMARLLRDSNLRGTLTENGRRITESYAPGAYRQNIVGIYHHLIETSDAFLKSIPNSVNL